MFDSGSLKSKLGTEYFSVIATIYMQSKLVKNKGM